MRRGVNPRTGIARDGIARNQGMGGSRAAARRDMRQQFGAKSKLTGRDAVRQRTVERRQQLIENRQAAGKARERLRANLKGDRVRDTSRPATLKPATLATAPSAPAPPGRSARWSGAARVTGS